MADKNLKTGELSENGQVEILDQDRLCYKVVKALMESERFPKIC